MPNGKMKLGKAVGGGLASFTRTVAEKCVNATSFIMIHQPKEPKNLAERLRNMKKI